MEEDIEVLSVNEEERSYGFVDNLPPLEPVAEKPKLNIKFVIIFYIFLVFIFALITGVSWSISKNSYVVLFFIIVGVILLAVITRMLFSFRYYMNKIEKLKNTENETVYLHKLIKKKKIKDICLLYNLLSIAYFNKGDLKNAYKYIDYLLDNTQMYNNKAIPYLYYLLLSSTYLYKESEMKQIEEKIDEFETYSCAINLLVNPNIRNMYLISKSKVAMYHKNLPFAKNCMSKIVIDSFDLNTNHKKNLLSAEYCFLTEEKEKAYELIHSIIDNCDCKQYILQAKELKYRY